VQSKYLIDRYPVLFDSGVGWRCVCAEFVKANDCRHTRESAGRLAAQDLIKKRTRPVHGKVTAFINKAEQESG